MGSPQSCEFLVPQRKNCILDAIFQGVRSATLLLMHFATRCWGKENLHKWADVQIQKRLTKHHILENVGQNLLSNVHILCSKTCKQQGLTAIDSKIQAHSPINRGCEMVYFTKKSINVPRRQMNSRQEPSMHPQAYFQDEQGPQSVLPFFR